MIVQHALPVCKIVGRSAYRYSRPNVYTKCDVTFRTPEGRLIRRDVKETGPHYVGWYFLIDKT